MKWITIVFLMLLFFPLVSSIEPEFTFPKNSNVTLPITCFDSISGQICDNAYVCSVTVSYPNGTTFLNNASALRTTNIYEINLTQNSLSGFYPYTPHCSNGTSGGVSETQLYYLVTPSGIEFSDTKTTALSRSIYIIFAIALILLISGFLFKGPLPIKYTLLIIGGIFILVTINLVFVTLQDAVVNPAIEGFFDFFVAASWYMYWFAGGLIILLWFVTVLNTFMRKKTETLLRRFGE